jgi:hypothetical protein
MVTSGIASPTLTVMVESLATDEEREVVVVVRNVLPLTPGANPLATEHRARGKKGSKQVKTRAVIVLIYTILLEKNKQLRWCQQVVQ